MANKRIYEIKWKNIMNNQQIFESIYKSGSWNGVNSISGIGSDDEYTVSIRKNFKEMLGILGITSVLDAGCGDRRWINGVNLNGIEYFGVDVVQSVNPDMIYDICNPYSIGNNILKRKFDAILMRDILVHLSFGDITKALIHLEATCEPDYFIVTDFTDVEENIDIKTGDWRALNMSLYPFSFANPVLAIPEDYPGKCLVAYRCLR